MKKAYTVVCVLIPIDLTIMLSNDSIRRRFGNQYATVYKLLSLSFQISSYFDYTWPSIITYQKYRQYRKEVYHQHVQFCSPCKTTPCTHHPTILPQYGRNYGGRLPIAPIYQHTPHNTPNDKEFILHMEIEIGRHGQQRSPVRPKSVHHTTTF